MRAYLRSQLGFGPLGLLLVTPLVLLAAAFAVLGLHMAWAAADHPQLLLVAATEYAGALAALFVVRRIQAAVPQELP
ncbi:hypothetical protein Dcar01_02795 [Deinococcus carri]|uniref:Uncharacterized protein n=1 Tax=Deinococcus carri TaxID=1211323 RepID=A0ABP9WA81_9DEIO